MVNWFIEMGNILIGRIMTVNGFSISCLEENYYHKVIRSYLHISQWEIILWISFFEKFTVTKLVTPDVKLVFSHFSLPQKLKVIQSLRLILVIKRQIG